MSDDNEHELFAAAKALLPHLHASTDKPEDCITTFRLSRAQRLRREADEIEAKDAAIERFRAAMAALAAPIA
jgi:hypothetical protein